MKTHRILTAAALVCSLAVPAHLAAAHSEDHTLATKVATKLSNQNRFRGVNLTSEDGIVTLSGQVKLYIDKVDAENKARKVVGVEGIRNQIEVNAGEKSDKELAETLAAKLRYDRVGYGIMFNHLTVSVNEGEVTLGGHVRDYADRNSALAIVETTPGVRAVEDEIDVAPPSEMDDQLRINLARAIYGHPTLQRYALDPQAPIRIVVDNGEVGLHGVVATEMESQIAFAQANAVPGSFQVRNNLVVAR